MTPEQKAVEAMLNVVGHATNDRRPHWIKELIDVMRATGPARAIGVIAVTDAAPVRTAEPSQIPPEEAASGVIS